MPISHKYKLIFIHIPKAAGTSIEKYMDIAEDDRVFNTVNLTGALLKHFTASQIQKYVSTKIYDSYETFTVIRNPWDRMVSMYEFSKQYIMPTICNFNLDFILESYSFEIFIELVEQKYLEPYFRDQLSYIKNSRNQIIVNNIFRFEDLGKAQNFLQKHLKRKEKLELENRTLHRKHYSQYYDDKLKTRVQKIFQEEIDFFKYKFEDNGKFKINYETNRKYILLYKCIFSGVLVIYNSVIFSMIHWDILLNLFFYLAILVILSTII